MSWIWTVAQTGNVPEKPELVVLCGFLIAGLAGWLWVARKHLNEARRRITELERVIAGGQSDDVQRNTVLYEQHRQMNALQIEKMQTELAMMQREGAKFSLNAEQEKDRYLAEREFHEIMVEKNRLEIENLRLHIRELRKRMEDWGSGHE